MDKAAKLCETRQIIYFDSKRCSFKCASRPSLKLVIGKDFIFFSAQKIAFRENWEEGRGSFGYMVVLVKCFHLIYRVFYNFIK